MTQLFRGITSNPIQADTFLSDIPGSRPRGREPPGSPSSLGLTLAGGDLGPLGGWEAHTHARLWAPTSRGSERLVWLQTWGHVTGCVLGDHYVFV